jgi:RNA polymerase sigma-70 factor (ECF subfamily)
MTPAVTSTTAPPPDLVQAALSDADVQQELRRHAHAMLAQSLPDQPYAIRTELVAEAVQETQVRALQKRHTFDPTRRVQAWLHGIMNNVLFESIRSYRELPTQAAADPAAWERLAKDLAPPIAETVVNRLTVMEYLSQLSADQQQLVRLRYYDELSHEEIAARLNITLANARVRLCRAIIAFKSIAGVNPKEERS